MEMDALTFQIVDVAVKGVIAVLMAYVLPVAKRWINQIMATKWAKRAVEAAQQLADIRNMDNQGKKAYAVEQLTDLLARYKIAITKDQIEMLIESAVKQMKIEEPKILVETEVNYTEDE